MDDAERDRRIAALENKIALLRGQTLTSQQKREVDWLEADEIDRALRIFPRSKYCFLVGRQTTALNNAANTHGIPLANTTVDIPEVLRWFHEFLAARSRKKADSTRDGDDEGDGVAKRKQALEMATFELKLKMLQADFEKKVGNSISADEVDRLFAWFEGELRKLGERLGKRFGSDAQNLFNDTLDRIGKHLEELMPKEEGSVKADGKADDKTEASQ
jgi:hypothetical protein